MSNPRKAVITEYLPGQNELGNYKHTYTLNTGRQVVVWSNDMDLIHPEDRSPISIDPYNDIRRYLPEGWSLTPRDNGLVEISDKAGIILPVPLRPVGQGLGRGQQVWQDDSSYMQQSIIRRMNKEGLPYYEFRSSAEQAASYIRQSHERMLQTENGNWLAEYRHIKAKGDYAGGLGVVPAIPIPTGMYESVNTDQALTVRLLSELPGGGYGSDMTSARDMISYLSRHVAYSAGGIGNPVAKDAFGMEIPNPSYVSFQSLRLGGYAPDKTGDALTPNNYYWRGFDETGSGQAYVPNAPGKNRRSMMTGGLQPEYGTIQGTGNYREFVPTQPGPAGSDSYYRLLGTVPEGFKQPPPGERGNWVFTPGLNPGGITRWHQSRPDNNLVTGFTTRETTDLTVENLRDFTQPGLFEFGSIQGKVIRANQRDTTIGTYNKPGVQGGIPIKLESPITDFYLKKAVLVLPLRVDESGTRVAFGEEQGISSETLAESVRKANPGLTVERQNVPNARFVLEGVKEENRRYRYQVKGQEQYTPISFAMGGTEYQYGTDEIKTSTMFPSVMWGSRSIEQRQGILSNWAKAVGTDAAKGVSDYYKNVLSKREGIDNVWDRLAGKYRQLSGNPEDRPGGLELANRVWNTVFENVREDNPESMKRNARNIKEYNLGWATNEKGGLRVSYPVVLSPEGFKLNQSIIDRGLRINHPDWSDDQIIAERNKTLTNKGTMGTNVIAEISTPSMFLAPNLTVPTQLDYNARVRLNLSGSTAIQTLSPTIAAALGIGNVDQEITNDSERAQFGFTSWRMYQKGLDEGSTELPPNAITMDEDKMTTLGAYLEEHKNANNLDDPQRQGSTGWYAGVMERTGDPNAMTYYPKTNTLVPPLSAAMASAVPETMGETVGQSVSEWVKTTLGVSSAEYAAQFADSPEVAHQLGRDAILNLRNYQEGIQRSRGEATKVMQREEVDLGIAGKYVTIDAFGVGKGHIFEKQVKDTLRAADPSLRGKKLKEKVAEFYENAKSGIFLRDPQTSNTSAIAVELLDKEQVMAGLGNTRKAQLRKYRQLERSVGNRVAIGPGPSILSSGDDDGDPGRLIVNAVMSALTKIRQLTDPEFESKIYKTAQQITQQEMQNTSNQYTADLVNANVQSAVNLTNPEYRATKNADPEKAGIVPIADIWAARSTSMLNSTGNMPMTHGFGVEMDAAAYALGLPQERRETISRIRPKLYQQAVDLRGEGAEAAGFDQAMAVGWASSGVTKQGEDYLSFGTNEPGSKPGYTEKSFLFLNRGAGLGTGGELKWFKQLANVMARQTTIDGQKTSLLNAQDLGEMFGSTSERASSITNALENETDRDKWGETIGKFFNVGKDNPETTISNMRHSVAWLAEMGVMYRKSRETLSSDATPEQVQKKAEQRRIMDTVAEQTGMKEEIISEAGTSALYRRYSTGQNLLTPNELRETIASMPEGIDKNHLIIQAKHLGIPLTPRDNGNDQQPPNEPPVATSAGPDEDPVRRKAIKAAESLRASGVSDTSYYNPLKNVLKAMDTPMAPEPGQKYIDRGEEVHKGVEKGLKEKYEKLGWGVDTELELEGIIGGKKVTGKLDLAMMRRDPDRPGYHIGMIPDIKGKTGVNTAVGQLSIYGELWRQEAEKVGIKFSRIELGVQPYEGGEEGLEKDANTIVNESLEKEIIPITPWSKKKLEARIEKVSRDQASNIEAAVELTNRSQDNQRAVTQDEIKDRTTYASTTSGRALYQARHPGEVPPDNPNGPSGPKGPSGGGGKFGNWRPPNDREVETAIIKAVGMLEKISPFQETAIQAVYNQALTMPNPQGIDVNSLDPDQLTRFATEAGGVLHGSPQLAMMAKTSQAIKSVTNRGLSQAREMAKTDPLMARRVAMIDAANDISGTKGPEGQILAVGEQLSYLTDSKASSISGSGKVMAKLDPEQLERWTKAVEEFNKVTTTATSTTKERTEAEQKLEQTKRSILREGAIKSVDKQLAEIETAAVSGQEINLTTRDRLMKSRSKLMSEEDQANEEAQTTNWGKLGRNLFGGWGLMYMRSIGNVMMQGAGGEGYNERSALQVVQQQAAIQSGGTLGAGTNLANYYQNRMALSGANYNPQIAMQMLSANNPALRTLGNVTLAALGGFAASEWGSQMLANANMGTLPKMTAEGMKAGTGFAGGLAGAAPAIAGIVGLGSLAIGAWAGSQDTQGLGMKMATAATYAGRGEYNMSAVLSDPMAYYSTVWNKYIAPDRFDQEAIQANRYKGIFETLNGTATEEVPGIPGWQGKDLNFMTSESTGLHFTEPGQGLADIYKKYPDITRGEVSAVVTQDILTKFPFISQQGAISAGTFYAYNNQLMGAGAGGLDNKFLTDADRMRETVATQLGAGVNLTQLFAKGLAATGTPITESLAPSGTAAQMMEKFYSSQAGFGVVTGRGFGGVSRGAMGMAPEMQQMLESGFNLLAQTPGAAYAKFATPSILDAQGNFLKGSLGAEGIAIDRLSGSPAKFSLYQQTNALNDQISSQFGFDAPYISAATVQQQTAGMSRQQIAIQSANVQTTSNWMNNLYGGNALQWGQIAAPLAAAGMNLVNAPAMQTTFGGTIGAEYAAFTGYNMAGQQTGGQWGRQSLQMGQVSAQTMAQRIYAPVGAAGNVMSNFSQYGQYGQAYIKAQIGNQQDGGVALDNGQVVGGAIGGQQYIMDQQYLFAQQGIAISREQNALSGASLAISYKQLAMTQAFQTGVGLGAYSGTINPQTGQPFGFSTGNYSFNAPGGYNFTSQGGGMWGIEDAQRNLGYAQTQFGFQMQQKQMDLQTTQFGENMAMQAQGMALNKAQGIYQYQYGTQMAERQFGFSQTMFEEDKRFLTGRQRRIAERTNNFNVETYNLETDNREKQFDFQKQQWKLQEEQFQLQIKQFNETKQLQQEQLDANRKFFEISKQLQEEATKLTRASWVNQIQLQKESLGVQAAQIALNAKSIDLQEKQMEFQRQINGLDLIAQTNQENIIDALNNLNANTFPILLGYIKEKIPAAFMEMINKIITGMGGTAIVDNRIITNDAGSGGGCFIAGTMVTMMDKSHRPIEDIVPGDMVLSYDTNTKQIVEAMVVKTFHHVPEDVDGYILVNGNIGVTREHEMYISGKWDCADNLKIGDYFTKSDGKIVPIKSLEWFPGGLPTFNLHTNDKTHNYFANGVLVHNSPMKTARGGDVLPGNSAIVGDSVSGMRTGYEEMVYARPGGGLSVTPVHGFSALASNNNGPSPENNTIIKRSDGSLGGNVNDIRIYIGNREITDFIVRTVEGELKNG